ncbi:MAG TPA: ribosome biogenesis GTPase YlqF [Bacillota bacterium]|jgi:ribosome biogenesis GTPase A|nr:ribosome biogenesis GTPase YlqF [Fastidiosipila sp.]HPX93538.1 ribosome biogenesis GTPase YlqF [Bacillota bacterium]HQB81775.1 ribosome biogenesis GTPase YlqF [Bacillota bacterium]
MKGRNRKSDRQIHWYPGHMAGAARQLENNWRYIDLVVEVADARIPLASRNPVFLQFTPAKPHLLILSHADLADQGISVDWVRSFQDQGIRALPCNLKKRADIGLIRQELLQFHRPLLEKAKGRGRIARPLRVLVAGIPNTGKSSLINQFVGKRSARVEARPGVTRDLNWLRSSNELHFLDTPGILPAKLDDRQAALSLAATGAIRDSILPLEEVARWLYVQLFQSYPAEMEARYGQDGGFEDAAREMGCLLSGREADLLRFSAMLLDDFRSGKIGRLTLEWPAGDKTLHD